MRKKKQGAVSFDRLNKSISKESRPNEGLENMMINDIKQVLNSYFVFQNDDIRYLFADNSGQQEFTLSLKYRCFKDVKVL